MNCGDAWDSTAAVKGQKHRCSAVRVVGASYDLCSLCYEGGYLNGPPSIAPEALDPGETVFIVGTWSNWSKLEAMRQLPTG